MAMTLTQLERYMVSEIENLHVKIDSAFELLMKQIQLLSDRMDQRFDRHEERLIRIESKLDNHEERLVSAENLIPQAN